ncbi:glycerol-3-phosphate acyltransferase [Coprothermobacteraceae bacterium]|nr:glycerol-3-phosphate acyltransferase [Coprothermobacteraceae bacterium]
MLFWMCAAYLLGSANTATIVCRALKGVDITTLGDGNAGATNVFRSISPVWGVAVGLTDVSKTWIMLWLAAHKGLSGASLALVGASVAAGHVYPILFRLKGGTGLASSLGGLLYFNPLLAVEVFVIAVLLTILWEHTGFTIHHRFDALSSAESIAFVIVLIYTALWGTLELRAFMILCTAIIALRRRHEASSLTTKLMGGG